MGEPTSALPLGNGMLCVSPFHPGLLRLLPAVETDGQGAARRPLDFSALPPGGTIGGGSTWAFQFWFRDVAAPDAGSDLTDALRVTFCSG